LIPSEIESSAGLILMKTGLNLMPDDNIKPPLNRFQDWKSGSVLRIGLINSDYNGFGGIVLYPPKEADIIRLCSQFS
jgi:hypothetical protein